ncbi:MAG TPA: DUF2917 domain-containing protein [Noviherbaspirillum sp.]
MRDLFTNNTLSVPAGQAVSGVARSVHTLRVLRGRVWITVEGISHDYFLHAGDTFTAVPGRLIVLEADQDAGIDVLRPANTLRGIGNRMATFAARLAPGGTVSLKRHETCSGACC